jgi:hypothetical protein
MVKISKVVSLLSCAFLLSLGLSNAALAIGNAFTTDEINAQQNSERNLGGVQKMEGEVLALEGDHYLVKRSDGKQVSLRMDEITQVPRTFAPGEWIEAEVKKELDGHRALSINPAPRQ